MMELKIVYMLIQTEKSYIGLTALCIRRFIYLYRCELS